MSTEPTEKTPDPNTPRFTSLVAPPAKTYRTRCNYCGQKIGYTEDYFDTMAVCPACQRETWLPRPSTSAKFKDFLKLFGRCLLVILRTAGSILSSLVNVFFELLNAAVNHFIGLVGIAFILGTLGFAMVSPMIVAGNVLVTGEGFGFVLLALDALIDQGRRRLAQEQRRR